LPDTSKFAAPETLPIKPPTSDVPVTLLPVVVLNAFVPDNVPPLMLPIKPPTYCKPLSVPELVNAPETVPPVMLPNSPPTFVALVP